MSFPELSSHLGMLLFTAFVVGLTYTEHRRQKTKEAEALAEYTKLMCEHYKFMQREGREQRVRAEVAESKLAILHKEVDNLRTIVISQTKRLSKYEAKS